MYKTIRDDMEKSYQLKINYKINLLENEYNEKIVNKMNELNNKINLLENEYNEKIVNKMNELNNNNNILISQKIVELENDYNIKKNIFMIENLYKKKIKECKKGYQNKCNQRNEDYNNTKKTILYNYHCKIDEIGKINNETNINEDKTDSIEQSSENDNILYKLELEHNYFIELLESEYNDNLKYDHDEHIKNLDDLQKELNYKIIERNQHIDNDFNLKIENRYNEKNNQLQNEYNEKNNQLQNEYNEKNNQLQNEYNEKNNKLENEYTEKNNKLENEYNEKNNKLENEYNEKNNKLENEYNEKNNRLENEYVEKNNRLEIIFWERNKQLELEKHNKIEEIKNRYLVSEKGYWKCMSEEDFSYEHAYDDCLSKKIVEFLSFHKITKMYDLGCGRCDYTNFYNNNGIDCLGIDGNPDTNKFSENIIVKDLTESLSFLNKRQFVQCLEVGEHVPKEYEQILIDNICSLVSKDGYLLLTWAIIGQGGLGHVNCQNNDYIKNELIKRDFECCEEIENNFRDISILSWFKGTIMVFKRN